MTQYQLFILYLKLGRTSQEVKEKAKINFEKVFGATLS